MQRFVTLDLDSLKQIKEEPKRISLTKQQAKKLSDVIVAALQVSNLSGRQLAQMAGITKDTFSRLKRGDTLEPERTTLEKLTPYLFRVVNFEGRKITLDTSETYEGNIENLISVIRDES